MDTLEAIRRIVLAVGFSYFALLLFFVITAEAPPQSSFDVEYSVEIALTFLAVVVLAFVLNLTTKKLKLQRRGKLIEVAIVVAILFLFLAPVVSTPNGSVCSEGCSNSFQLSPVRGAGA